MELMEFKKLLFSKSRRKGFERNMKFFTVRVKTL